MARTALPVLASTAALMTYFATVVPALASQTPSLSPAQTPRASADVRTNASNVWTLTDVAVQPGERVVFAARGSGSCSGLQFGPTGLPRGFQDLLRVLPVQTGRGALIGRIGEAGVAQPFEIGTSAEIIAPAGGVLALGVNRADTDPCTATFTVHIEVFPPLDGASTVTARHVDAVAGVDDGVLGRLPRRVRDSQGNAGDIVNFLILGSEAAMQRVFKAAGWVMVDADVPGALISGIIASLSKQAYLTLPMSPLFLFGRSQDFGWAHAEPITVAASRHHLRVWRAPGEVAGTTLWAGAATHDIGFERDQRNNGITHKIDPNVDVEREFVEKSLTQTGLVTEFAYTTPRDAVKGVQKTATGGTFQSDGRVLVLKLSEDPSKR
jgi:hypothetical protein